MSKNTYALFIKYYEKLTNDADYQRLTASEKEDFIRVSISCLRDLQDDMIIKRGVNNDNGL